MLQEMRRDRWKRKLPDFGGVRVFEEGEKTFRPHSHWVMTPRFSQARIQEYADKAGLGHVWLDYRPATAALSYYLSKYLSKSLPRSAHRLRRWSCFGSFSSVKVKDVEVESPEILLFREHFAKLKADGMPRAQAYTQAAYLCNLSRYRHAQVIIPQSAKPPSDALTRTDKTLIMASGKVVKNSLDICKPGSILPNDETPC